MITAQQPNAPVILIVDDTPTLARLLVRMLAERGYNPRPVLSAKLALQAARAEQPDLILLDINMPEMNGYEVCEQLKADAGLRDIPVIFLSGLSEMIDKVKAFRVGGVDYVTKPFEFEEINARVETHLRIRSLQRQLREQNDNLERLVADRTRELAKAYERLQELGRLKNNFMRMISHEIRTPANGVLGVGNLILDLCPASEDRALYADLFEQSSTRLRNLIEDAATIIDMEKVTRGEGASLAFPELLAEVCAALPDIRIAAEPAEAALQGASLKGFPPLLKRALESIVLLALSFSRNKSEVQLAVAAEERALRLRLEVDALSLSAEQVDAFFDIESGARSASAAEWLGLAPVVARQIITTFGGELRMVKGEGLAGYLEAVLITEPNHA